MQTGPGLDENQNIQCPGIILKINEMFVWVGLVEGPFGGFQYRSSCQTVGRLQSHGVRLVPTKGCCFREAPYMELGRSQ